MEFRILGPLEVLDEGRRVALGGSKPRALLALLLLHRGETLGTERLVDELWGERPPATAAKSLRVHVSRLRRALAAVPGGRSEELLVTRGHGYQLVLDPECLDAHRFERLAAEGRGELAAGRPQRAAATLEQALWLWRGRPLDDLAYEPFVQHEVARLEDLRLAATEELVDARLALGRHAEVVAQLERLIADHPYRERSRAQLMLALYRCDRQAEALQVYQDARRTLVDDLGIEPGERLRELERAILAQDPALALPAARPATGEEGESFSPAGELPTGVVTFLLTDIEGSSGLWEADAGAMAGALELHDELIARAVDARGGRLLKAKGEGDATLTVFRRASDAVACAVELQAALRGAAWPRGLDPRVRVALHTGEAHEREGDYYGPALNRAARLRGLARGGTIVLSQATAEIVRERLPPEAELVELGRQELRGLSRPENVFELRAISQAAPARESALEAQRAPVAGAPDGLGGPSATAWPRLRRRSRRARALLAAGGVALVAAAAAAVLVERGGEAGRRLLAPDTVGAIDPASGRTVTPVHVAGTPDRLVATDRAIWAIADDSGTISKIDIRRRRIVGTVPPGSAGDVAAGAGAVWTVDQRRRRLIEIDPEYARVKWGKALPATHPSSGLPAVSALTTWNIAVGAGAVWVAEGSSRLMRLDLQTRRLRQIDMHRPLNGVTVYRGAVWATSGPTASVLRIDPAHPTHPQRIAVVPHEGSGSPYPVAIEAGLGAIWALNGNTADVTRIDPDPPRVRTTIPIGVEHVPYRLAVGAGAVWVADADGTLARVDPATNAVVATPVAHGLNDVAVAGRTVWVSSFRGYGAPLQGAPATATETSLPGVRALPSRMCSPLYYRAGDRPRLLITSDLALQNTAQGVQMTEAIEFALHQRGFRAGHYPIAYQACDDSAPTLDSPNPFRRCAPNARAYARDPSVIGVIGTFQSACAARELPILNGAPGGPVPMISPSNTYIGLTRAGPGAAPGDPGRYMPTGKRSYVRIVAPDDVQGAADALLARRLRVRRAYVLKDASIVGTGLAAAFRRAAARLGIRVQGMADYVTDRALPERVRAAGADGVFFAGGFYPGAVPRVITALRRRLPRVKLLASDGFFVMPWLVKLTGVAAEGMTISRAGLPLERLPAAGARFLARFRRAIGEQPDPYSVYAAQATNVLLDAIARSDGTRASVVRALFATRVHNGIVGSFTITPRGDTTARKITIYRVAHAKLRPWKVITPPADLLGTH